ncbi:hypothetical protein G7Z17_g6701 [Cylindrodendrum hubeiense]|uniref:Zn(2)-C6 fungal-type domain-containing protein n=1 Tax=Cylindrodendrum hubeiense TaxID=595255 RepID=A0A9P5HEM8_9HYPO|nr:hypothetical protein G7Z17_g6701 [Cylindrodendrum hubeiense]
METVYSCPGSLPPSPNRRSRSLLTPETSPQAASPVRSTARTRVRRRARRQARSGSTSPERSPRRSKIKPCPMCPKMVSSNAFADHIKVHMLLNDEHGIVATRPCDSCRTKKRECRVARVPGMQGLKTLRCRCCLQYHESCSYMQEFRSVNTSTMLVHPAMDQANTSETSGSESSDVSEV